MILRTATKAIAFATLLGSCGFLWAGFSEDGEDPKNPYHEGKPLPQPDSDKPDAKLQISDDLMDRVRWWFTTDPNAEDPTFPKAEAKKKIEKWRKAFKKAIEFVKKEDNDLGECLEKACKDNRLCFDFGSCIDKGVWGVTKNSKKDSCDDDKINLHVSMLDGVMCDENGIKCLHWSFYRVFSTLLHEAVHMKQPVSVEDAGNQPETTVTDMCKDAANGKLQACKEIEAINKQKSVTTAIYNALTQWIADGQPPQGLTGAAKAFFDVFLAGNPDPANPATYQEFLNSLLDDQARADTYLACQNALKAAYTEFLGSPKAEADEKKLKEKLKVIRWPRAEKKTNKSVNRGNAPSGSLHYNQEAGLFDEWVDGVIMKFDTGLKRITDLHYIGDQSRALVIGLDDSDLVRVLGYQDLDGDGFLNEESELQLIADDRMTAGAQAIQQADGSVLFFEAGNSRVYRGIDSDRDGFVDLLLDQEVVDSRIDLGDVIDIASAEGDTGLLGGRMRHLNSVDDELYVFLIQDLDGDGQMESVEVMPYSDRLIYAPSTGTGVIAGSTVLPLQGLPGHTVEVDVVDTEGAFLESLGEAVLDSNSGEASLSLRAPLLDGQRLSIRDRDLGMGNLFWVYPAEGDRLSVDSGGIDLSGGEQGLHLDFGPRQAGSTYLVLGSATGISPATPFGGISIPLVFDGYTDLTINSANTAPFLNTLGVLDAEGQAQATIQTGRLTGVLAPGTTFYHAAVLFPTSGAMEVSEATSLTFFESR